MNMDETNTSALAAASEDVSRWFEVEVRLYRQTHWRRTTALVGGIKDGFPTAEAAREFITTMVEQSGDVLYEDADWRVVQCERRVLAAEPATMRS